MRILILTHNYPVSPRERANAGIFVHDLATELAKTNTVSVVCPAGFEKKTEFNGVTVYFFSWAKGRHLGKLKFYNPLDLFYGLKLFSRGFKTLQKVIKQTEPEFVLAMWTIPAGIFAYFSKIKFGIPYTVWVLGSDFYIYGRLPVVGFFIRRALKNAKYTFADGLDLADRISKITERKCLFLPSSTKFELTELKKVTGTRGKTTLTFVGRMEPVKGPDLLLDAVLELKGKVAGLRINFVGDGSLLPALKAKAKKQAKTFHFWGNIDNKRKLMGILQKSEWVVIPSRSDSIPLVFSEAMKAGVPVIASALPDLSYLVKKYNVGLLFEPENTLQLSSKLEKLPSLAGKRSEYAENTKTVVSLFSIEESAKKLSKVIRA